MPTRYDHHEIEAFGGPSPDRVLEWHRRGLLEDLGEQRGRRWRYSLAEVIWMLFAGALVDHPTYHLEIDAAISATTKGSKLLFAYLVEGHPTLDNKFYAERRAANGVVMVTEFENDPDKRRVTVDSWMNLTPARFSEEEVVSIVIRPRGLMKHVDPRLKRAFLKECEEEEEALRVIMKGEWQVGRRPAERRQA